MATRVAVLGLVCLLFFWGWFSVGDPVYRVLGQPTFVGAVQSDVEAPHFSALPGRPGLRIRYQYQPMDKDIPREESGLDVLKSGLYDVVSLRFAQLATIEPVIGGIDIPGMATDFASARTVSDKLVPVIDKQLRERWNARLLGLWAFGPQVVMCTQPISVLGDLRGVRVRVSGAQVALFVSGLGGHPLVIPVNDTERSLAAGAVQCAITSLVTATSLGWLKHARHVLLAPVQFGINGYAISEKSWARLDAESQAALRADVDALTGKIWALTEKLHREIVKCAAGAQACPGGVQQEMVAPTEDDLKVLRLHASGAGFLEWRDASAKECPACASDWQAALAGLIERPGATTAMPR